MKKEIKIKSCKHGCPFFGTTMDAMECRHPYFDELGVYENMIIDHDHDIPIKCPLRKEPLDILYKLEI